MGTYVVVVEQQAAGTFVWTACTPSLEDFGQANVDVPLDVDCLPLLGQDICLEVLLDLLNFTDGLSPGKS